MTGGALGGPPHETAELVGPFRGDFYQYTEGIEQAIDLIVAEFERSGRDWSAADTLVYPLGLLCRHLVELRLKQLYLTVHGSAAPRDHELLPLWRALRKEIEAGWPKANSSTQESYGHLSKERLEQFGIVLRKQGGLDRLGQLIKAFHDLDKSGQSFRYPGSFKPGTPPVSLHKLEEVSKEISAELDGFDTAFIEERDRQAEADAYHREQFEPPDI